MDNSSKAVLLETVEEANTVINNILAANVDKKVIGIDCEASGEMSKFGKLCLLQISFNNDVFIFDMLKLSGKDLRLNDLFNNKEIVKVFHDCLEDCAIMSEAFPIKFQTIFDTQIAHRILYEQHESSVSTIHNSISLNDLIKYYFNIDNPIKEEIQTQMSKDLSFWEKRPLDDKMKEYASKDVIYLPLVYNEIVERMKKVNEKLGYDFIMNECKKLLAYLSINTNLKRGEDLTDKVVKGILRNFQKNGIFIKLNLGVQGFISNKRAINHILRNNKIGDILSFLVLKYDEKRKNYLVDLEMFCVKEGNNSQKKATCSSMPAEAKTKTTTINLNVNEACYYPSYVKNKNYLANLNNNFYYDNNYVYVHTGYNNEYNYNIQPFRPVAKDKSVDKNFPNK